MPIDKDEFDDLRSLTFREPEEVLDGDKLYTIYEIARLLQGIEADAEIDAETEAILLDWAIPWVITNSESFVFAEPRTDDEPGYYGIDS